MTLAAVDLFAAQPKVLFLEASIFAIVTRQAKLGYILGEQRFYFAGMRFVAPAAIILSGRVCNTFVHQVGNLSMAIQAEPGLLVEKQLGDFASVWIVATGAITVGYRLMLANNPGCVAEDIGMAAAA